MPTQNAWDGHAERHLLTLDALHEQHAQAAENLFTLTSNSSTQSVSPWPE